MGSVMSELQFISYKVDDIQLTMNNTLGMLAAAFDGEEEWKFQYGLNQPIYLQKEDIYIAGTSVIATLGNPDNPSVKLKIGITGMFKILQQDSDLNKDEFIKIQMPAILSPYLRSAITYIMVMAGFGQVIPPLVNFRTLAEELLKDKPILIQDNDTQ